MHSYHFQFVLPITSDEKDAMEKKLGELNRKDLKSTLELIYRDFGLKDEGEIDQFLASRNSLIHMGQFLCKSKPNHPKILEKVYPDDYAQEFYSLFHFLDRLVLKILGYGGPYQDWGDINQFPIRREQV